ncbi:MAG TPA: ATP synthase F0 subunit C [Terriglobales bacterium]|nr:ATP synthase F0 subunit C [Terriglobales bacterium]
MIAAVALFVATPAFAQGEPAAPVQNWAYAGIALAIAVALAAYGQSRVASSACEGIARNPAARPGIQLALILGLAFIESLVLFIWVMIFLRAK